MLYGQSEASNDDSAAQTTDVLRVSADMISTPRGLQNLRNIQLANSVQQPISACALKRRKPSRCARACARRRSRMSDKKPALIAFDLDGTLWYVLRRVSVLMHFQLVRSVLLLCHVCAHQHIVFTNTTSQATDPSCASQPYTQYRQVS